MSPTFLFFRTRPRLRQDELAKLLISPDVQVAFNLKKGSLPVRGDVNLQAVNDCVKKGLKILAGGRTLPDSDQSFTQDTVSQLNDLFVQFFANTSMSEAEAQSSSRQSSAPLRSSRAQRVRLGGITCRAGICSNWQLRSMW